MRISLPLISTLCMCFFGGMSLPILFAGTMKDFPLEAQDQFSRALVFAWLPLQGILIYLGNLLDAKGRWEKHKAYLRAKLASYEAIIIQRGDLLRLLDENETLATKLEDLHYEGHRGKVGV